MGAVIGTYAAAIGSFLEVHSGALSAIAAVAIAGFTYTLWRSTAKMQASATATLEHLEREFEAEHRPWIRVEAVPVFGLTFESKNPLPTAYFEFTFHNSGRTPALHLTAAYEIVPPSGDPVARQRALAEQERNRAIINSTPGISVFPNQEQRLRLLHAMGEADIEAWCRWIVEHSDEALYAHRTHLIGCATYVSAFGTRRFQTGIICELHRLDPPNKGFWPINPREGSVSLTHLTSSPSEFGCGIVT